MLYGRRRRIIIIHRIPPRRIRSSSLACTTLRMLFLILLLLAPNNYPSSTNRSILVADAFATNLVNTGIGCMTELSTDEVIMNEEVKPPEQSDFPKMYLAVLDKSDTPIDSNRFQYDPTVPTMNIAFVNPYSSSEFNEDLQFVMEIEGPTEDSKAAEFVDGGLIGCDHNKRVSNNLVYSQASVVLQINDPTATLRIWAGWATGHNAVRLVHDLVLEPGQAKEQAKEKEEQPLSREEEEEELENLEEELAEEEFRNTDKEKLLREEQEEKLEKLLNNDEPKRIQEEEQRALSEETTQKKNVLQRKRKNVLEKPGGVPEGLLNPNKRDKDLVLEIARKDRERGQRGNNAASETRTIQQKLKDKQIDLGASNNNNNKKDGERQRKIHSLTDHTNAHRQRRDIPETIKIYDDVTDDDLPELEAPMDVGNDDVLPDEGDIDDGNADIHTGSTEHERPSSPLSRFELQLVLDGSNHFLACVFFAASMTLFLTIFGKKREKGRRDL